MANTRSADAILRFRNDPRIRKVPPYVSLLCMLGGVIWILLLPLNQYSRQTYISENALLPGQVHTYFGGSEQNIFRAYKHELASVVNAQSEAGLNITSNAQEEVEKRREISDKVEELFQNAGLKTGRQHYRYLSSGQKYPGENVYSVLNAPRGDSTEAIVLVAALKNAEGNDNINGVALLVTLARYFKRELPIYPPCCTLLTTSRMVIMVQRHHLLGHSRLDSRSPGMDRRLSFYARPVHGARFDVEIRCPSRSSLL